MRVNQERPEPAGRRPSGARFAARRKRGGDPGSFRLPPALPLIQGLAAILLCLPIAAWGTNRNRTPPPEAPAAAVAATAADPALLAGRAIWAGGQTGEGTVALFRHRLALAQPFDEAQLDIVADTRYEVWLDGQWLGRGPARFSQVRQEYDTYSLGSLDAGNHLLAVLVQYAPNTRRSESGLPALQAGLQGRSGPAWQWLDLTGLSWKAVLSPAWKGPARRISLPGLLGPMEVLDLRLLPRDWMQPSFDDATWPAAQAVVPAPFPALSPRTISPLREVQRLPVATVEAGLLSPGWELVEFEHPTGVDPAVVRTVAVTAPAPAILQLESLDGQPVALDGGAALTWQPVADPRRPDVLRAEVLVPAGTHTLAVTVPPDSPCPAGVAADASGPGLAPELPSVAGVPDCIVPGGRTLAINPAGVTLGDHPGVVPVRDPGRRTLLANPVEGGETQPQVELLAGGGHVSIPGGEPPRYVVLDLGRTVHGRLSLVANGPAGTIVDAGWDERLTEGRPLPNPGSLAENLWSQVDSWTLDGTERSLTTIDSRAGRYLLLQVFGPGPVDLDQIRVWEETYAGPQVGRFASSDPLLDRIWQTGVDTLVPNMTDAYTDTPWRERGQWWGDAMISFAVDRAAFGDLALFRRGLHQMADGIGADGRPEALAPNGEGVMILDFGMEWVEGLHLYWSLSGDLDLVAELYPAAQRLAAFVEGYRDPAGLLYVPPAHWSQSAFIDWSGYSSRSGESTALNAQYAAVLGYLGEMAAALGDPAAAQAYAQESADVRDRINAILYLPDQGCYAASRLDGQWVAPSPHAQAWALRYDAVPPERRASTAVRLVQGLSPFFGADGRAAVEPLGMAAALDALQKTGHTGEALDLIREVYGGLIARGATTWWELFTPNQMRANSLSHAWGGSPTWFLSSHVLGGQWTGPGRWRVAPHPGGLEYAGGAVPLDTGALEIDWQAPQCGQFDLVVTAPAGTTGDVLLSLAPHEAQVTLDGTLIWSDGPAGERSVEWTDAGLSIPGLAGGEHQLSMAFGCYSIALPAVGAR